MKNDARYNASKIREYIQSLDTIGKEYDFEYESASFFNVNKIRPELFIKNNIDEKDTLVIINALLEHNIMPEYYNDYTKLSLIELAIKEKYSVEFIKELIDLAGNFNLDIVGIASNSLSLMLANNYPYDEILKVITKFFEYGYNFNSELENDSEFNKDLKRNPALYDYLNEKDIFTYNFEDLLTMYKYTAVNPKNMVKYLFPKIQKENYTSNNIELICSFFKCNLDRTSKIINEIAEINFEIPHDSLAYKGLKNILDILLSEFVLPETLYQLYCSLLVQNDIFLLDEVLYNFKYGCNFDFDYYGNAMLSDALNILGENNMDKIIEILEKYGYKKEDKEQIRKSLEQTDERKQDSNKRVEAKSKDKLYKIEAISEEFKGIGNVLNNKNYISMPGVGRDDELKSVYLGLARRNGSVILVGESGVGKTEITNRLAWQIQNNKCPDFLKDRIIIEVYLNNLIAGSMYRGSFEEKMKKLFEKTKKYHAIVVINEIHNVFGLGASADHDFDLSEMLKTEIEEGNIQVIGTTTKEEYEKYFASSALKRRFKKIDVAELSDNLLFAVFNKVIEDLCNIYNIELDSSIEFVKLIDVIIKNTSRNCRPYNDRENNPSLGISIIEDAFAFVVVNNRDCITIDNFIEAFKSQDRLYESVKKRAINELEFLKVDKGMQRVKSNIVDIGYLRRNK